jgi:hypothetical protein
MVRPLRHRVRGGRQFGVSPYAVSKAIARATELAAEGSGTARGMRRLNSILNG